MMAMALAGEPDLLIADEPTTALDSTTEVLVLALMKEVQVKRGMGLVLISHDLSVVSRVCERVVVLYGGQVVESGPTRDILTSPKHPYTVGLLKSRLRWEEGRRTLEPIPGEVPEAVAWPQGCRFHTRCSEVLEKCGNDEPPMISPEEKVRYSGPTPDGAAAGRGVRCWLMAQQEGT
jgi:oligopeptide/dipeptide ABC transporter ATP-binding protein